MKITESSSIFDKRRYYCVTAHTSYLSVSPYLVRQKYRTIRRSPTKKVSEKKRNSHLLQLGKSAQWKTFITLTFNDEHYCDRDYQEIQKQFRYLFNKLLPRALKRKIKYLAVLEHGSENARAHYHVLTDVEFDAPVFRHHLHFRKKIMPIWKGGFSDVAPLDGSNFCVYYLMKYLGKTGVRTPVGKREIFTSTHLARTVKLVLPVGKTRALLKMLGAKLLYDAVGYQVYVSDQIPQKLWYNTVGYFQQRGQQDRLPFL